MTVLWWAIFLASLAGAVLAGGSLTRLARPMAAVSLGLFVASVVLMLVTLAE